MVKKYDKEDISPCPKCHCMTKSIRLGRAKYKCGKCGADKSLSDVFFYEATHKKDKQKLWLRNLDCGHSRPTNIAFISGKYEKPKVGDKCYCRECWKESTIISVEEVSQDD